MKIEVAGAGAGKTFSMASRILADVVPDGKVVFCVSFTNAAARNITSRLIEQNAFIPNNIKVSTIHSFLHAEIVQPYYHLLFGKRFSAISTINLPNNQRFKNAMLRELEGDGLLHQTSIPQKARWVVDKKSNEKALTRKRRLKVLKSFASYCHKIIVDEAQDIDKDMKGVLLALDRAGISIELFGDPKQDVRGYGCFQELILSFPDDVTYKHECHRCPEKHLVLSNRLANEYEQQLADEDACEGSIDVCFESDLDQDVAGFLSAGNFGLSFISRRTARFDTHEDAADFGYLANLQRELKPYIVSHGGELSELGVKRLTYLEASNMLSLADKGITPDHIIGRFRSRYGTSFSIKSYARVYDALSASMKKERGGIAVKSIEAIKGLEAGRCLFILTTDLAPHLFGEKSTDNKTRHLLYVALTRSRNNLTILVTKEVEEKYSRKQIKRLIGAAEQSSLRRCRARRTVRASRAVGACSWARVCRSR